jgi:hypothetical protein
MPTNISAVDTAKRIADKCHELGWEWYVRGNIFTITKEIKPNNNDDFNTADMEYYTILSMLPTTRAGSTWGTDGSGIGALSAIKGGLFKMNKSGGSKLVLNALSRMFNGWKLVKINE